MIVTSFEAQAMMGWAAILALRVQQIIADKQAGYELTIEEVIRAPYTEGLVDGARGMTPEVRKTVQIVLDAIYDIRPELLQRIEEKGVTEYVVV